MVSAPALPGTHTNVRRCFRYHAQHTLEPILRTQCRRILNLSSVTEEPVALRLDFLVALADLVLEASVDEQQVIPRFVLELPGLVAQEQLALHLFKDEAD